MYDTNRDIVAKGKKLSAKFRKDGSYRFITNCRWYQKQRMYPKSLQKKATDFITPAEPRTLAKDEEVRKSTGM
jgi:hypothetical protein